MEELPERVALEINSDEQEVELTDQDIEDIGYTQRRLCPMQTLRDHIVIVKALGVLIILFVCLIVVGIVGIISAEPCSATESDCIIVSAKPCYVTEQDCDPPESRVYIDVRDNHEIVNTRYTNLTTCIFIHHWRYVSYGSNFTVCQTDAGPATLDIYLNGGLSIFTDTEQWEVLKYMIPQIDASIEKAGRYLSDYVPDTLGE
jgi:hypothetical protein